MAVLSARRVLQLIGRFFDACEMISPYTPYCKDFACIEQPGELAVEDPGRVSYFPVYRRVRAEDRGSCRQLSGHGDAAAGIIILSCAGRAGRKFSHRGTLTVVRERIDDTVAGSAVHAGSCPVILISSAFVRKYLQYSHRRSRYPVGSCRSVNLSRLAK